MTAPSAAVEVISEVLKALGDCEEGRPVDFPALRQFVQSVSADLWALEHRVPDVDDKWAVGWVATTNDALLAAVDRLEDEDIDGARLAIRDAWHAPAGQRAPRLGEP